MPTVSVIVLSHNRPQFLDRALDSLRQQSYHDIEITVVDNHSPSSSTVASLVARYPEVKLLALASNSGYTGGMNAGIRLARGEYIYLTEDDVVCDPACIEHLVAFMQKHLEVGIASGIMYNKGSGTVRCAGGFVSLDRVFKMTVLGAGAAETHALHPYQVNFVPGAMLFARASLMHELQGFRPSYFMYFEDVELCLRVQSLGVAIAIIPQARCFHWEPQAVEWSATIEYHKLKNFVSTYVLHASSTALPGFIARYFLADLAQASGHAPQRLGPLLRAWFYVFCNMAPLLKERRRCACHARTARRRAPGTRRKVH